MPGTLFVVATPIGHLEDITMRALRVLRTVAVIAAEDTRRTAILLRRYEIATPTLSLHEHNERQRTAAVLQRMADGESVALVSDAGTPLISDPGARLVRAAIDAGIRVEPVPGPSAVMAALSVSGLPSDRFTFLGFAPSRAGERARWFEAARTAPGTLVFFEAPQRIRASLQSLLAVLGDRQLVLARELTKVHESVSRGWVSDLITQPLETRGEYTVLVSDQLKPAASPLGEQSDENIVAEFSRMTKNAASTPRDAVAAIVRAGPRRRQDVYSVLRRAGKLG